MKRTPQRRRGSAGFNYRDAARVVRPELAAKLARSRPASDRTLASIMPDSADRQSRETAAQTPIPATPPTDSAGARPSARPESPIFVLQLKATPADRDPVQRLRAALKVLARRFNLQCTDCRELESEGNDDE